MVRARNVSEKTAADGNSGAFWNVNENAAMHIKRHAGMVVRHGTRALFLKAIELRGANALKIKPVEIVPGVLRGRVIYFLNHFLFLPRWFRFQ
jgi:hypothetical protein